MRRAYAVATAALVACAVACSSRPPENADYARNLEAARVAKDAAFERGTDSPVPANRRAVLLPLAYFPVDPAYSVPAILVPTDDAGIVDMPTSTGQKRQMRPVGRLKFTLKGQALELTALVEVGAPNLDHLFVPFTDLTTGTETYAAGRYLDLERNATGIYVIDFNRAYQPYCYYNPTYDCPYPPAENRLPLPIHAGERLKQTNR